MFREMRRKAQSLTTLECERILESEPRGVLALLGDEGYPYAVPLDFVYFDRKIYFHSAVTGHKLDAIATCDKASFCVMDKGRLEEGSWWYHFNSVIAFGHIRRIEDNGVMLEALRKLGNKYFPSEEETEAEIARNLKRVAVLELAVEHLSGKRVREK